METWQGWFGNQTSYITRCLERAARRRRRKEAPEYQLQLFDVDIQEEQSLKRQSLA